MGPSFYATRSNCIALYIRTGAAAQLDGVIGWDGGSEIAEQQKLNKQVLFLIPDAEMINSAQHNFI